MYIWIKMEIAKLSKKVKYAKLLILGLLFINELTNFEK